MSNLGMPHLCERCGYNQEAPAEPDERRIVIPASVGPAELALCMDCLHLWGKIRDLPLMRPRLDERGIRARVYELAVTGMGLKSGTLGRASVEAAIQVATEYTEADRFFDKVALGFINGADYDVLVERAGGAKTP